MRHARVWLVAAAAAVLVFGLTGAHARTIHLSAAEIRIELNATDLDAGIQIFLDGEGWDRMIGTDPDGNTILDISAVGSIGIQGITELFFESAEPSLEEQSLEELFELFPEGIYRFEGTTTEGDVLKGRARLTHALPDGPERRRCRNVHAQSRGSIRRMISTTGFGWQRPTCKSKACRTFLRQRARRGSSPVSTASKWS